ncbi:uncharacterized protein LOC129778312 [Toxorhynchites rutilus septentrionalis]|uniref:uncharacterized protein LOC129778312 n=1 Tax=Toxorhynchites rutilus septentrionalis TaxID=329112 RepID=UPI002479FC5E|nr:uncharacterized protein LOC129778312 [Toxorhynchites rutilus septentrionalis]
MKGANLEPEMHQSLPPKIWKRDEMLAFLDIFESTFHSSVSDPFDSEADMWECISNKLHAQGYTASAQHCQRKWNFLYKTYINNQNTQGVYYAKIKRIVEFSQQLNEQSELLELNDDDDAGEEGHESQVKNEFSVAEEEHLAVEMEEEMEQVEPIEAEFLTEAFIKSDDGTVQTQQELTDDNAATAYDTGQKEPIRERHSASDEHNLMDVLLDIVKKIEVIQKVQKDQGQRLKEMESLHLQNRFTLLEIKKHLNVD